MMVILWLSVIPVWRSCNCCCVMVAVVLCDGLATAAV